MRLSEYEKESLKHAALAYFGRVPVCACSVRAQTSIAKAAI